MVQIAGLRLQLTITYPLDPDLTATLYYDSGRQSARLGHLVQRCGSGTKTANFTQHDFR